MAARTEAVEAVAPNEERERVISQAVCRAADILEVSNGELAAILGLSGPTISRLRRGLYRLRHGSKEYELALLLIRLYRSLDSLTGGDTRSSRSWIRSPNTALNARPMDLAVTISGLVNVVAYLDSRRGPV